MGKRRVVITSMGLVSCFGNDPKEFYQKLLAGESGVVPIEKFSCDDLQTKFGAPVTGFEASDFMDKKQARRLDPCIKYAVGAGKMALENAKLTGDAFDKLDKTKCGVLIGSGMGGMDAFVSGVETLVSRGPSRVSPFFVPFIITNMPGATLAIDLGFQGPNYSISTACATSNYSIAAAANHIRNGDADLMICGGAEASINKMCYAGFNALKALSTRNEEYKSASRPWDTTRDGFVIGEGCGALVLESLEHALARGAPIIAEYLGGAVTCDASHMTDPIEDGSGVAMCIDRALNDAEKTADDVDYINAHATSTPVGDLCEVRALKTIFKDRLAKIPLNATKSMIGHALGAAGGLEIIAAIMAIQTSKVHPTLNLNQPESEVQGLDGISDKAVDAKINTAISNSFGFGGHNSVLVVGKYTP